MSKTLVLCVTLVALNPLAGQSAPLSVRDVKEIFGSGGDVWGWDEFDIPEFLAAAYGLRARDAVIAILAEPPSPENAYVQLEALTAAGYSRLAIPTSILLAYAVGEKRSNVGVIRHRAISSLALRPDSSLVDFWLGIAAEPDPSFRQLAAAGLACALGTSALPHLERFRRDVPAVTRVAEFYLGEFATKGDQALACGGRFTRQDALDAPREVRAALMERGARIRREIP